MTTYSSNEARRFFTAFDSAVQKGLRSPVGKILFPNGWSVSHTGGGCLAWEKSSDNGKFSALITFNGVELGERIRKPEKASFDVGLYPDEGGFVNHSVIGVKAAMAWCDAALSNPKATFANAEANGWLVDSVD